MWLPAAGREGERECHTSVPNAADRTLRPEYPSRGRLSIAHVKTDRPPAWKALLTLQRTIQSEDERGGNIGVKFGGG